MASKSQYDVGGPRHPDSGGLLSGTKPAVDVVLVPRYMFLQALRAIVPDFWLGLHGLWVEEKNATVINWWIERAGVVDPWLAEVVWDTINHWNQHPESHGTRLEPDQRWWHWKQIVEAAAVSEIPVFCPQLQHPFLIQAPDADPREAMAVIQGRSTLTGAARNQAESIDEFERRMMEQFQCELRKYTKWLRTFYCADRTEMLKHSEWTVLVVFRQVRYVDIANRWPGLRHSNIEQPEKAVAMAVKRFAETIGLTLPRKRNLRRR
jgi:hypothetical protein